MHHRISYALALLVFVTACGGSTKPVWEYGLATRMDQRTAAIVSNAGSKNLVTDADTLTDWTLDGGFALGSVTKAGKAVAELTGTGLPTGADMYSGVISVTPGATYTFSVWADPSRFSKNKPILMVMKPSRDVVYGYEFHFSGPAGRFYGTVTIPKDVTQVRLDVGGAGATIAKKQKFRVSQPVFMAGSVSTPHAR